MEGRRPTVEVVQVTVHDGFEVVAQFVATSMYAEMYADAREGEGFVVTMISLTREEVLALV